MLVKVVTPVCESIYHCFTYIISPKNDETSYLTIEGLGLETRQIEFNKESTVIYVMNDQGQTVETKRWPKNRCSKNSHLRYQKD